MIHYSYHLSFFIADYLSHTRYGYDLPMWTKLIIRLWLSLSGSGCVHVLYINLYFVSKWQYKDYK